MTINADYVAYREEYVDLFEQSSTKLMMTATQQIQTSGAQAIFTTAGASTQRAVTRGVNGNLPASSPDMAQVTLTMKEYHAVQESTDFLVYKTVGDVRRQLIKDSVAIINREIDHQLISALGGTSTTAPNVSGDGTVISPRLIMKAKAALGNNEVPVDEEENMFLVASPTAIGFLSLTPEFASSDYVDLLPNAAGGAGRVKRWNGVNIISSSLLSGIGTSAEKCFLFHRRALGLAIDKTSINPLAGTEERHGKHWARTSVYMTAGILMNAGIIPIYNNGTAA